MSKSQKTYELEEIISIATARPNRVGCAEVSLDDFGIVDFIAMDIDGGKTIRCYELKISKSDFLSDAKKSFVGDFNYYVIPTELWDSVKGFVEKGVGVWVVDKHGHVNVRKKASRMKCKLNRANTLIKILRALNRENLKHCENNWRERQLNKKVKDFIGTDLSIGDIVEYRGIKYKIISINYSRNQMKMESTISIQSVENTNEEIENIKASICKKVSINDIIPIGE